jgi:predicted MFS family arabinose efflux permease
VSYLAFLAALARIRIETTEVAPAKSRSMIADLGDGIRYTASHPGIAALLVLLTALGVGARPLSELLPGIAADIFNSGSGGFSVLASSMGGGAVLGGLWLGQRARSSGLTRVAIGSSIVGTLATVAAIATDYLSVAVPAVAAVGFAMSAAGIAIQSSIQLATDSAMRGRVMGLYGLIFRGAPAIGALGAGAASAYFGLRTPVLLGALVVVAACFWTYLRRERIAAALEKPDCDAEA